MADRLAKELTNPTLMRAARGTYAGSIRAQLHAVGITDLPRNGAFLLAGIDTRGGPAPDLPSDLGITKQAVSQVIDILVNRGYLERGANTDDRRRINLVLTERGQRAVDAVLRGVEAVDTQLRDRLSSEQIATMRSALSALAQIKLADTEKGSAKPRKVRQLRRFDPVFPVRDLDKALEHYQALGFRTLPQEVGDSYGFANRDGSGLHFCVDSDLDPSHNHTSTYLYVNDADELYEEWSKPGIGGATSPVETTGYNMREGAHVDPDGNEIRFGSDIPEG